MATVDLDKLSAELTAAGVAFGDNKFLAGHRRIECFGWTFNSGELVDEEDQVFFQGWHPKPEIWPAIDIIRRHVAPVAPDPGLREAIAKALAIHAGGSEHEENFDGWVEQFDGETDAVLAVLAERGAR